MIRRHARSEKAKIVRKLRVSSSSVVGAEGPAAAEIGSRVFPLRAAPPAHMPAVGARRSTRVFVPKATTPKSGGDIAESRVLRSGRNRLSETLGPQGKIVDREDEWARVFGSHRVGHDLGWWKGEDAEKGDTRDTSDGWMDPEIPDTHCSANMAAMENLDTVSKNRFGLVYSRKRLQKGSPDCATSCSYSSAGDDSSRKDRKYGIYFMRDGRKKRQKIVSLTKNEITPEIGNIGHEKVGTSARELRIATSSRNLAQQVGILENDILTGLAEPMILILLVETSNSSGYYQLARILTRVISCWTRRPRFSLSEFAGFFLLGSLASRFSELGLHVFPVRRKRQKSLFMDFLPSCGLCKIYGARQSVPLLCVDFLALPIFFKTLHMSLLFRSLYLPCSLARCMICLPANTTIPIKFEGSNSHIFVESSHSESGSAVSANPIMKRKKSQDIVIALKSVAQNPTNLRGISLRKHKKRRSSSRINRQNPIGMSSQAVSKPFSFDWSTTFPSESKKSTELAELVGSLHVDVPDAISDDYFSSKDESDISTPFASHDKPNKLSKKSTNDQTKELKSALADVKQDILSARCKANILVTDADRCWREEGYEIMMDLPANDWCLSVKAEGKPKYIHRPQDLKSCIVNRFTHSYMWAGEDGWKLEFIDRWDWFVFKEMHSECLERNRRQVAPKLIPVPGVFEVLGYEVSVASPFSRPEEYIRMMDDEVQRALTSDIVRYDMDSGDEDWLNKYNSSSLLGGSKFRYLCEDTFEKIMYMFEKDVYQNVDDVFDKERAMQLYQDLGSNDLVSAVHDYWLKKRTKRQTTLVRVFQGPPLQRKLALKPYLRKRRSFNRQRSQSSRSKPEQLLLPHLPVLPEVGADEESLRRVKEAESAAKRAVHSATRLRKKAQLLMEHADLATYKSVIALRITDSIEASISPDFASVFD